MSVLLLGTYVGSACSYILPLPKLAAYVPASILAGVCLLLARIHKRNLVIHDLLAVSLLLSQILIGLVKALMGCLPPEHALMIAASPLYLILAYFVMPQAFEGERYYTLALAQSVFGAICSLAFISFTLGHSGSAVSSFSLYRLQVTNWSQVDPIVDQNFQAVIEFIGFAGALWVADKRGWTLGLLLGSINVIGALISGSRAAIGAILITFLYYLLRRRRYALLAITAFCVAFILMAAVRTEEGRLVLGIAQGLTGHDVLALEYMQRLAKHPLLGDCWPDLPTRSSHNTFLDFGSQFGIFGLVNYLLLFLAFILLLRRRGLVTNDLLGPSILGFLAISLFTVHTFGRASYGSLTITLWLGIQAHEYAKLKGVPKARGVLVEGSMAR